MKKVMFFINTLSGGGAEKVLINTVNNLDLTKYEITIYTLSNNGVHYKNLNSRIICKSLIRIKNEKIQKVLSYLFQFIIPARLIHKCFVGEKYDIEIAYLEGFPTKLIAASTNEKSKKYAWVHTDLYRYYDSGCVFKNIKENRNAYKNFDKIFCVSEDVRSGFYKRFNELPNVHIQYNVINDVEILRKSVDKNPFKDANEHMKIVAVGRLCEQKGFIRLINCAEKLVSDGFKFQLFIIGEGEDRCKLEQLIKHCKLEKTVYLTGFTDNPYKYIANSDLFVCSSLAEGYSTVVIEALILGRPIITTDCSGMREILGNSEYGIIVNNTEEELYLGLKEIFLNPSQLAYYSKQARIRSSSFSMDKRIYEYEQILDQ